VQSKLDRKKIEDAVTYLAESIVKLPGGFTNKWKAKDIGLWQRRVNDVAKELNRLGVSIK